MIDTHSQTTDVSLHVKLIHDVPRQTYVRISPYIVDLGTNSVLNADT